MMGYQMSVETPVPLQRPRLSTLLPRKPELPQPWLQTAFLELVQLVTQRRLMMAISPLMV